MSYTQSLFRRIFQKGNTGLIFFFLINIVILRYVYLLYFILMLFIGEPIVRALLKCREAEHNEHSHLSRAFANAYAIARGKDQGISENVKIYTYTEPSIEVQSYGRNTIVISTGALNLDEDQLQLLLLQGFA